jgi:tetratricopeptide (TPR) repeat protein
MSRRKLALRLGIAASLRGGIITLVPTAEQFKEFLPPKNFIIAGSLCLKRCYEQAAEFFIKATELAPAWAEAHNDLGMAYKRLGRLVQATEAFKFAINASPYYALAYFNLAGAYRDLGRYGESVSAFQKALNIEPNYPAAYNNLGVTYDLMGRYRKRAKAMISLAHPSPPSRRASHRVDNWWLTCVLCPEVS